MLKIELTPQRGEHFAVYLSGQLICEGVAGLAETRDDLTQKVERARCLSALPRILKGILEEVARCGDMPDDVNQTPARKRDAWMRGLIDGASGKTVPYPGGDSFLPPIRPEHDPSYTRGYDCGEVMRRVSRYLEGERGSPNRQEVEACSTD